MKSVIIVAGGASHRFEQNKLFASLYGKPLILTTVGLFDGIVDETILVVNQNDLDRMKQLFDSTQVKFVIGGTSRSCSVVNGLAALSPSSSLVAIHDGARPHTSTSLIRTAFDTASKHGSAIPVLNFSDTAYQKTADTVTPIDRTKLCCVQTPQVFVSDQITLAYAERDMTRVYTDDSQVYLDFHKKIEFIEGEVSNKKITFPSDLYNSSIGNGFDVHPLIPDRRLILGGVEIPHELGLDGHSDADVVVHAIMDALLMSVGERDIGNLFPDTDNQYKDISSLKLLGVVSKILQNKKTSIQNISCVIMAEEPKLSPYIPQMCQNIASTLGLPNSKVNISATTTEKLGIIGNKQGIAAQAVCLCCSL